MLPVDQERKNGATNRPDPTGLLDTKGRTLEESSFALLRDNVIEALRILVLRRWAFFIPFCVVTCIAALMTHRLPRAYTSSTVIERRDHPVLMNLRQTAATGGFALFFRPTLARDLTSRNAMTEVVEHSGLIKDLSRDPDGNLTQESRQRCAALGAALAGGIDVRLTQKDDHFDQIQVAYTGSDPVNPPKIVREVRDTYIRNTRQRLTDMLLEGKTYFERVAREHTEKAARLEEDLLRFQSQHIGVDPTDPGSIKLAISNLEHKRSEIESSIERAERETHSRQRLLARYKKTIARIADMNPGSPPAPALTRSPEATAIENEIRGLQKEIHDLQMERRMTDLHPEIVNRRDQIARLREQLKQQYIADAQMLPANRAVSLDESTASSAVDAAFGWTAELDGIQMEIDDRKAEIAEGNKRLESIDDQTADLKALEANVYKYRREYQAKADQVAQERSRVHENMSRVAEIDSILNADESERGMSFTELKPANACTRPSSPHSGTILAMSLLAGLAAGAVCVLLTELFDQRFRTTRQVTRSLGIALLETIDEITTSADRIRAFRRKAFYVPATVAVLLLAVGLTCASAYLSIERPSLYHKMKRVPEVLWNRVSGSGMTAEREAESGPVEPVAAAPLDERLAEPS